jgi:hypothetical protein
MRAKRAFGERGDVGAEAVWRLLGAAYATAPADAVVCRQRDLNRNQISTIANGTFAGLTALTLLYGAGLWAGLSLLLASCLHAWI